MTVIAIGALGGSGTRAIAQVLIEAGIYMGDDLNQANDNLIFTRLFKNPAWKKNATNHEITQRLNIFNEYMVKDKLCLKNAIQLYKMSLANPTFKQNDSLLADILKKTLNTQKIDRAVWGWKEPNTQVFINEVMNYFPKLKYIHVLRHGLDMAFSKNKQQLLNWGQNYGLHVNGEESEAELAYKQMSYWVGSTKNSLAKARSLGDRFLLINHSDFCSHPKSNIDKIVHFLELPIQRKKLHDLYQIPQLTKTVGRYKKENINMFDDWQIDYVKELGFNI